jgi:predicted transcriptional regulator
MEEYLKAALEIVKAQASVRTMTDDEITSMLRNVAAGIQAAAEAEAAPTDAATPAMDPSKAVKESSVVCLECGKSFKVLTKKHLAAHNLTPEEYRTKYGYKKGAPLAAKSLQRERRKVAQ